MEFPLLTLRNLRVATCYNINVHVIASAAINKEYAQSVNCFKNIQCARSVCSTGIECRAVDKLFV